MRTTITKLAIVYSLLALQLANAQAPLLPLFENNTIKWGAHSYTKRSDCGIFIPYDDIKTLHEIIGDTIIDTEIFKIISTKSKSIVCSASIQKYLKQDENLIFEVDKNGVLIDTILFIESISLGSRVKCRNLYSGSQITLIDTILFDNLKLRRLKFGGIEYIDGIGFGNNGPFASQLTSAALALEAGSFLDCYSKNGLSYSIQRNSQSNFISAFGLLTTACENPLGLEEQNGDENRFSRVSVNQNNQLETSQIANSIEIFDSKGQKVLQNTNASLTDISSLTNGFYIANITFANMQVKHKFLVNNWFNVF